MIRPLAIALLMVLALSAQNVRAEGFAEARLKTVPLIWVIRIATEPYQDGGQQGSAVLAPEVRTLVRLAAIARTLTPADLQPTTFFGDARFLPDLAAALDDAGLSHEAAAFRAAIPGARPAFGFDTLGPSQVPHMMTLTLGDAFGTKAALEDAILAYAGSHAAATAWCDTARDTLSDDNRLYVLEELLAEIPANATPAVVESWPEPYRRIQLASIFEGQLSNGDIEQYFWNFTGALAPATVDALRAMNLIAQAEVIAKELALFPPPYPVDTTARQRVIRDGPAGAEIDRRLAALSAEADLDGIQPAMVVYARRVGLLPH